VLRCLSKGNPNPQSPRRDHGPAPCDAQRANEPPILNQLDVPLSGPFTRLRE
jgi:hypothetical protein